MTDADFAFLETVGEALTLRPEPALARGLREREALYRAGRPAIRPFSAE